MVLVPFEKYQRITKFNEEKNKDTKPEEISSKPTSPKPIDEPSSGVETETLPETKSVKDFSLSTDPKLTEENAERRIPLPGLLPAIPVGKKKINRKMKKETTLD